VSAEHDALVRRNVQLTHEFHARRSGFIVRAALMFNVPCAEVTPAKYAAAVERTEQDTMPGDAR
jgi:hypothetical protein